MMIALYSINMRIIGKPNISLLGIDIPLFSISQAGIRILLIAMSVILIKLLLDEHTASLDPARAELITRLTDSIVREMKLTT